VADAARRRRFDDRTRAALEAVAVRAETARRLELGSGEAVLRSVVEAAVALFDAEAASIALYDPTEDRLVFRVAAGEQGQGVVGLSIAPDQGLVGYVYQTSQALALSDVTRDPRFGRSFAEQTNYVPRSIVAVPLVDDRGAVGVLEVLDKRSEEAFSLRDIELASVFARQAAVAIRASRVERESAALLDGVLHLVLAPDAASGAGTAGTADASVVADALERMTAALARDDPDRLWALVEQIARVRAADPGQLALVTDLIAVLADHAARPAGRRLAGRSR